MDKITDHLVKKETNNTTVEGSDSGNNPSSSDCDSNDGMLQIKGTIYNIYWYFLFALK